MSDVSGAKQLVVEALKAKSWLQSVGIGLMDETRRPGVVVSVSEEGEDEARGLVEKLKLDVPVKVRVAGPFHARTNSRRSV